MTSYTVGPFIPVTVNTTIDKVVFQIERLSGQFNELSSNIDVAAGKVADKGKQTFESIKHNFQNDTVGNFNHMIDVISDKTHNWPLTELIIAAVAALIFLLIGACYMIAKGGEKAAAYKYQKRLINV